MRAQLRTYHAIPSLQARQDPHAYKQLQDAPRLKSILKGGAEDRMEPNTLDDLKFHKIPRTNPVNLLFVICQAASKVAELHFPPGCEFHDLIMKTQFTSKSRARAFLWIMWFYLESDFTEEGCEENPFGAGVDYGVDVANQGVPELVLMTNEEEAKENVDPQEEIDFGYAKQKMRAKIIEADQQYIADSQTKRGGRGRAFPAGGDEVGPTTGILPRIRPSKHESDLDSVRSTPPPRALAGRQSGAFGSTARRSNQLKYQILDSSPGGGQMIEGIVARKPRPPTAHQLAVERNRSQRVEYILDRGIRRDHHRCRKQRKIDGSIIRALGRLEKIADDYDFDDSEDEDVIAYNRKALANGSLPPEPESFPFRERGYKGLVQLKSEPDDFGEEFSAYSAALRRADRRLTRWHGPGAPLGVVAPIKQPKMNGVGQNGDDEYMEGEGEPSPSKEPIDPAETEDETEVLMSRRKIKIPRVPKTNGARGRHVVETNGADTPMDEAEDLDDVDRGLLGLDDDDGVESGGEQEEGDAELDDVDKTLLGMDGDTDSE